MFNYIEKNKVKVNYIRIVLKHHLNKLLQIAASATLFEKRFRQLNIALMAFTFN